MWDVIGFHVIMIRTALVNTHNGVGSSVASHTHDTEVMSSVDFLWEFRDFNKLVGVYIVQLKMQTFVRLFPLFLDSVRLKKNIKTRLPLGQHNGWKIKNSVFLRQKFMLGENVCNILKYNMSMTGFKYDPVSVLNTSYNHRIYVHLFTLPGSGRRKTLALNWSH